MDWSFLFNKIIKFLNSSNEKSHIMVINGEKKIMLNMYGYGNVKSNNGNNYQWRNVIA
jgi:hypothetical protein